MCVCVCVYVCAYVCAYVCVCVCVCVCFQKFIQEFMTLYNDFQEVLHDMDRQMSTIIIRAFDDCVTLESCFKVFNCYGKLQMVLIRMSLFVIISVSPF